MKKADITISVLLMAASAAGFFKANTFRDNAGLLPKIIFVCLFLCGLALFMNTIRHADAPSGETAWKPWLTGAALMLGYIVAMATLGFYIATALFILCMMRLFGIRKWQYLTMIPLGFDLVIFLVFSRFLGIIVPMPFFM